MEGFRERRTPESRTPYVLAVMGGVGAVALAWRWLVDSQMGLQVLVGALAAAVAVAVWRYGRQRD